MKDHAGNISMLKYQTWHRKLVKESIYIKHYISQVLERKKFTPHLTVVMILISNQDCKLLADADVKCVWQK